MRCRTCWITWRRGLWCINWFIVVRIKCHLETQALGFCWKIYKCQFKYLAITVYIDSWMIILRKWYAISVADPRGAHPLPSPPPPPHNVPILSFWPANFTKHCHVRSLHPLQQGWYGKSWIRQWPHTANVTPHILTTLLITQTLNVFCSNLSLN